MVPLVSVNPSAVVAVVEGQAEYFYGEYQQRLIEVILVGGARLVVVEIDYPMVPVSSYRSASGIPYPGVRPPGGSPEWDMYDDAKRTCDSLFDILFASIQRRYNLQPV